MKHITGDDDDDDEYDNESLNDGQYKGVSQ